MNASPVFEMKRLIQAGLAGYGMAGQVFHAPLLNAEPSIQLKTVLERSSEQALLKYPEVSIKKDYQQLLADRELDLIVIALPNQWHFPYAKQALEAGKHVVVDKPFCIRSEQAEELIDLAEKKGLLLSVFQNRRLDGGFLTVQQIIEDQKLGDLKEYEAHFDRYRPQIKTNAWRESGDAGSGILYDLGSHLVDQAYHLFGEPKSVSGIVETQREGAKTDDYFQLTLEYEDFKAVLSAGMLVEKETPHFQIKGSLGEYVKFGLDPQESQLKAGMSPLDEAFGVETEDRWGSLTSGSKVEKLPTQKGVYTEFYRNVAAAIVGEEALNVPAHDALFNIRIIESFQ